MWTFSFQTHICVEQTAIELLSRNLKVHIIGKIKVYPGLSYQL